jgi:tripartite-type tricarboxylate transporter receptor subunit TctC
MLKAGTALSVLAAGVIASGSGAVHAASTDSAPAYPHKPIRMVTSEPGGGSDFAARVIAQAIAATLGQPVIVDNRVNIAAIDVSMKAPPDGYTLFFGASTFIYTPLLRKMFYDPLRDFVPVSAATTAPSVLAVYPSLPAATVKELIALAQAKPGALNYASTGVGSGSHLAAALFTSMAGINVVHVPYKSTGPSFTDLISGRVQFMIPTAGSVTQHLKSGKLRALAVTTEQPSALFPGVPTVAASGVPGYVSASTNGVYAPAGTPAYAVNRLNQEIVRALNSADVKQKFFDSGSEVSPTSPAEFTAKLKSEIVRIGKVIKDSGITAE